MSAERYAPFGRAVVAAFIVLLLNSAYLAAYATPSIAYFVNVVLHAVLGVVLTAVCLWRLRRSASGDARTLAGIRLGAVPLAIAAAIGLVLLVVGATIPYAGLLRAHI